MKRKLLLAIMIVTFIGFTACRTKPLTDVDGNVYKTITLGKQVWMVENLKTTKLNDGTPIELITDNGAWINVKAPAFCWVNNDVNIKDKYGALYNWNVVDTRKICPVGWHVPSFDEWQTLVDYLQKKGFGYKGDNLDVGKAIASQSGWESTDNEGNVGNNQIENNKSGFSAVPSGIRGLFDGSFENVGSQAWWWSDTNYGVASAQAEHIFNSENYPDPDIVPFGNGLSIRCVKDK